MLRHVSQNTNYMSNMRLSDKGTVSDLGTITVFVYLTAVGLTTGGSSTEHIYTHTIHRIQRKEHT
jgi:hypothetical protein